MDFLELSRERYSVRNFDPRPVGEETLEKILEAGRLAPTAVNAQPQKIYLLKSREALEKLRGVTRMAYNAPVVLMVCYDEKVSWKATPYGDTYDSGEMDASIVTTAMMMQAAELGVGSLWARGFKAGDIEKAFALPENIHLVCLLDLGYPAKEGGPSERHSLRKPLSETVTEL